MRSKRNISTVLYLLVSACLLTGVMYLGSNYISDNTAEIPKTPDKSADSLNAETESSADETESGTENSTAETENIITEEETEDLLSPLIESLYILFEENAPERWEKYDEVDWSRVRVESAEDESDESDTCDTGEAEITDSDSGDDNGMESDHNIPDVNEPHPEYVKMYPKLAYFYKDLESGKIISYNADEILYSASLIKAPYIFAVTEEIDAFITSKLPPEAEPDTGESAAEPIESESAAENKEHTEIETEINAEPETSAETVLDETEAATEETGENEEEETWYDIEYSSWEKKYDLGEIWTYNPWTMYEEGSGEIIDMPDGTQMTWMELFDYTLLHSDNVAFAQIRQRFGYSSFYKKVEQLGIKGTETGFMNLSARDCGIFLEAMYEYFGTGSDIALHMRDTMADSKQLNLIASHYPEGTAAHKYGWDLEAFHDMSIIYDDHPYILVIMTDYEDGGREPTQFFADVVNLTKQIHAEIHKNDPPAETKESALAPESTESAESQETAEETDTEKN